MKFRCPDSLSGICTETRCGGHLVNPREDGLDDNLQPTYTAACVFDGSILYFNGLHPEKGKQTRSNTIANTALGIKVPILATESPVPIGKGFPFITYCDPDNETLRMKVRSATGEEMEYPFKIGGEERWHYVLQFVKATRNRVALKPFKRGKPINLSLVFRNTKDHNHRQLYSFTRTTGGSKAKYWLEQTQLKKRSK